jgi:integrase
MELFKRGKYYHVRINRTLTRSLKSIVGFNVTDEQTAELCLRKLKQKELESKIAALDQSSNLSIDRFISVLENDTDRLDRSKNTHRAYRLALTRLKDCIGDVNINRITKENIKTFKRRLHGRVSVNTANNYLNHIKCALNWAVHEGYLKTVPEIKFFKRPESIYRPIDLSLIDRLYKAARELHPEMEHVIRFALFTGMRRLEITNARWEHIRKPASHEDALPMILVRGKGKKERYVPIVPMALDGMVVQDIGKIFSYKSTSTLSNYFREICSRAGVLARFHDLRHTSATQMLSSGINIHVIKDILGHSDLKTTEIYAKILGKIHGGEMLKLVF